MRTSVFRLFCLFACLFWLIQPAFAEESVAMLSVQAARHQAAGRLSDAEQALQHALQLLDQKPVSRDKRPVEIRHQLARVYHAQGREEEAERLLKSVLAIFEDDEGPHGRKLAVALTDLALVYEAQGRQAEMEPILQRLVKIRHWRKASEPLDYAQALNALAAYYHAFRYYAEAVPLCEEALAIDREMLGDDHPEVAADLNNLAVLHQQLGRQEKAKELYRKSIAAWEASGPLEPGFADTLNDYAVLLRQQNQSLEAQVFETKARMILSSR